VQDGWELGCHTATHPDMNSLTEIELKREIVEAKSELEKEFDTLLKYIAYPKGQYNQKVIKISKEARFELGLTVDEGDISPRTQPLLVPRICIDRTRTLLEYSLITNILIVYLRKFMTDLRRLKD
jgi:peptidoglycan/xylan/chitin deacetylase (PgdA/CDA1 family)